MIKEGLLELMIRNTWTRLLTISRREKVSKYRYLINHSMAVKVIEAAIRIYPAQRDMTIVSLKAGLMVSKRYQTLLLKMHL